MWMWMCVCVGGCGCVCVGVCVCGNVCVPSNSESCAVISNSFCSKPAHAHTHTHTLHTHTHTHTHTHIHTHRSWVRHVLLTTSHILPTCGPGELSSIVLALSYLGYAPEWAWTVRWCHVAAHR